MSSGKRRKSWRWRYWLGSARRPPPPGTTISERASRRKKRRIQRILVTDVRKSILGFVEKFNAQNTSDLDGC